MLQTATELSAEAHSFQQELVSFVQILDSFLQFPERNANLSFLSQPAPASPSHPGDPPRGLLMRGPPGGPRHARVGDGLRVA